MTVPSSLSKHVFSGNGVNRTWPYTFSLPLSGGVADASVLHVYRSDNGGTPYLVSTSAYTVDVDAKTVTYPLAALDPLASTVKLVLIREVDFIQETELENNGAFYAKTHEAKFDDLEMQIHQLVEKTDRAVVAPVDDSLDPETLYEEIVDTHARYAEIVADTSVASAAATAADAAKSESLTARDLALAAKTAAQNAADSAVTAKDATLAAAQVLPWDATKTYNYPDLAAYTDGHTYRCIGSYVTGAPAPSDSNMWVRVSVVENPNVDDFYDGGYFKDSTPVLFDGGSF